MDSDFTVLGYTLRQLGFIRMIPKIDANIVLEFRRYFFRSKSPILQGTGKNKYASMPTGEQILLVNIAGDAVAILEPKGFFRGMYHAAGKHFRAKVNIESHNVAVMLKTEVDTIMVGSNRNIRTYYEEAQGSEDTLR